MSDDLLVEVEGRHFRLAPTETMTFGRWAGCSIVFDTFDRGISRIAASVGFEHGTWWVANCSENHELYIIDALGLSAPLPVAQTGMPASKRAVEPAGIRVLILGHRRKHEIRLALANPDFHVSGLRLPTSDTGTIDYELHLTSGRKAALVAMVSGYLKPYPRHTAEPLGYPEIARMLGLPVTTVRRRIEAVRDQLTRSGVAGLQVQDARRPLAEWLLANRRIVPEDLDWLEARLQAGASGSEPDP